MNIINIEWILLLLIYDEYHYISEQTTGITLHELLYYEL